MLDIMRSLRKKFGMTCVALAMIIPACDDSPSSDETIRKGAEKTGEALERGAEVTGDALKKAAESTGEVVTDVVDATKRIDVDVDITTRPATTTTAPAR